MESLEVFYYYHSLATQEQQFYLVIVYTNRVFVNINKQKDIFKDMFSFVFFLVTKQFYYDLPI